MGRADRRVGTVRLARGMVLGVAALLAASCGTMTATTAADAGREAAYDVPLDEARQVLAAAEQPPMVFGDGPVSFTLEDEEPTRFVWSVSKSGREVMRYTADLSPGADGGTTIRLALRGSDGNGHVEDRLAKSETIRTLYLVAMQERIAADLEGREYDMWKVYPAMTRAAIDNLDMFEPPKDRSREVMKQAYRDELEAGRNY